jgi:hypothetical protein
VGAFSILCAVCRLDRRLGRLFLLLSQSGTHAGFRTPAGGCFALPCLPETDNISLPYPGQLFEVFPVLFTVAHPLPSRGPAPHVHNPTVA